MNEQTQQAIFRDLGSMDARIGNIENDVSEHKADMREVKAAVAAIPALTASLVDLQASVKVLVERGQQDTGARRMLWKVGGASSAGGGLLVAVLQWLSNFRGPHP